MLSDYIVHSHDFSGLECVNITKRNLTLIMINGVCWKLLSVTM